MRIGFASHKLKKENSTKPDKVAFWNGIRALYRIKSKRKHEKDSVLYRNSVTSQNDDDTRTNIYRNSSHLDKSINAGSDNGTVYTTKSSSLCSSERTEDVSLEMDVAFQNDEPEVGLKISRRRDTKSQRTKRRLMSSSSLYSSEEIEVSCVGLVAPNTMNPLEMDVSFQTTKQLPRRRNGKNTRTKRRLRAVWGLHWECQELQGEYTGSAISSASGEQVAHGYGTLRFINGDVYIGPFYYGEMHGNNATYYYHPSKGRNKKYCGSYRHNQKHGPGKEIYHSSGVATDDMPGDDKDNCSVDSSSSESSDEGISIYDDSSKITSSSSSSRHCFSFAKKTRDFSNFISIVPGKNELGIVPEISEEELTEE